MNTYAIIFFGLLIWLIITMASRRNNGPRKHCMTCGTDAPPKQIVKGHILIELILWLCFLVPGLIYSIWRMSSKYEACSACGAATLVPLDAPAANAHRKQLQAP